MDWVSDSRRKGDEKKEYAIKAENAKNIGNSGFGQSIMNKTKHKKCRYVDEKQFNRVKNDFWFCDADDYGDKFEVIMNKKNIKQDMPEQIGFGILQDAKLRMLQFYYDC